MRARIAVWDDVLISLREAARRLSVHVSLVYKLVRTGKLTAFSHPSERGRFVRARDVERYRRQRDRWLAQHGRDVPQTQKRPPSAGVLSRARGPSGDVSQGTRQPVRIAPGSTKTRDGVL